MFDILNYDTFKRLLLGLGLTLELALLSIIISLFFGLILGTIVSFKNKYFNFFARIGLEFVRVMPVLVWLFLVHFGLAKWLGLHFSTLTSSLIVFGIWGSFEMMDLVRAALLSIPKHQFEAGLSLGLSRLKCFIFIIIPLATRRLLPSCINLLTRLIKSTSVIFLIGGVELLKIGQQIIEANIFSNEFAPFIIYSIIFFLYFILCYPISLYSKHLEKKYKSS